MNGGSSSSSRPEGDIPQVYLEEQDAEGNTPLLIFAERGDEEAVARLIAAGANINHQNQLGRTALMIAVNEAAKRYAKDESKYINIVRLLIDAGAALDTQNEYGSTALMECVHATYGSVDCIKYLLNGGASTEIENNLGETALLRYTKNQYIKGIRILLQHDGVNIDHRNNGGKTALYLSLTGSLEITKILLDKGATVDIPNNFGVTPLMFYAHLSGIDRIDLLLAAGADVDWQDNSGNTALIIAVKARKTKKTVQKLLNAGATIGIQNKKGQTAMDLVHEDDDEIRDALVEASLPGPKRAEKAKEEL
jgi:ankyrin repeat protein